jgi:RimJ/RimL family protein N-acetyltransferase
MQIETERLLIREFTPSDWQAVHDYAKQAAILIYEAWGPNTEADTRLFVDTAVEEQQKSPRDTFELAIILKSQIKLIGGCSFRFAGNEREKVSMGYIIHPEYWKNGYATEASIGLINEIKRNFFGIKVINATCDALNIASQRVLQKSGFQRKDVIDKDFQMKGRWRNTFLYELSVL